MCTILDGLIFSGGFAACWLLKDKIIQFLLGTDALIKSLEAKAGALKGGL